MPALGTPWPAELPSPLSTATDKPIVHATGVPPIPAPSSPPSDSAKDTAWLAALKLPDLAVRWDPRVVRYPRVFQRRSARARDIFTPLQTLGALSRRHPPCAEEEVSARGSALGVDGRERVRSDDSFACGRRRALAVHARDGEDLRAVARSLARHADERLGVERRRRRLLLGLAPPLRQLGARARGVRHGVRRRAERRASLQHERLLGPLEDRRGASVGDDALRAEDFGRRDRLEEPPGVRFRRARRRWRGRRRRRARRARNAAREPSPQLRGARRKISKR